ncbi:hypothetical protein [Salinibius halmophilus]|uniref:hypothetical protein n=1 Tax=Salinibius halmophilus TaxID=1853216 RepID=UPI000E664B2E|nr:hypothetical protein [Salinibius halmophilus]
MIEDLHRICWRISPTNKSGQPTVQLSLVFGTDVDSHGEEMPLDTIVAQPDEMGEIDLSEADRRLLALTMTHMVAGDESDIMAADSSIVIDAIHVVAAARFAKPIHLSLPSHSHQFVQHDDYDLLDLIAIPSDTEYPLAVLLFIDSVSADVVLLEDALVNGELVPKYNLVTIDRMDLRPAEFGNVFGPDDQLMN